MASDLLCSRSIDTEQLSVVMPSRRARTFLTSSIGDVMGSRPIWQPRMLSIDDMMSSVSSLVMADRFRLITELYKVYSRYHNEDFDHFYHWGDLLLRDFDTIDNYMVDAGALFANISDIKDVEECFSVEFTASQIEAIRSFWRNFLGSHRDSKEKSRFISIWKSLHSIYLDYREELERLGIGYKGMIYRKAAEMLRSRANGELFSDGVYAIVGFNALSASEKELFGYLKRSGDALFYWDVDDHFLNNKVHESAQFIRENIRLFGQNLDKKHCNNYIQNKEIRVVEAPSSSIECRYAAQALSQMRAHSSGLTAVVLTDEKMLLPLLYSMPKDHGEFNVTLGYDLKNTPAFTLVEYLIKLQQVNVATAKDPAREVRFHRRDIEAILDHPYLMNFDSSAIREYITSSKRLLLSIDSSGSDRIFEAIFSDVATTKQIQSYLEQVLEQVLGQEHDDMASEALTLTLESVIKVASVIKECDIDISIGIYLSLLRKHLSSLELPFIGEPLIGTQIMGILESRIIDFENVIILSTSEEHFPGKLSDNSFVPYSLKQGFGLPTLSDHEAMYGYYFYRLLYRARRVDIVYSSSSDGVSTGEPSRFIRQLEYDATHPISKHKIDISIKGSSAESEPSKPKDRDIMAKLERYLRGEVQFSPSSLFRYIECPYIFYLHDIMGIKIYDEQQEELDAAGFGTVMHSALEAIYNRYDYAALKTITLPQIEAFVDRSIEGHLQIEITELAASVLSMRSFIVEYIRSVVDYDRYRSAEFRVISSEERISGKIDFIASDGMPGQVRVSGLADRIDELKSGVLRIIDYKSGSVGRNLSIKSIESLFDIGGKDVKKPPFQALLYAMLKGGGRVVPALYFARSMRDVKYSPYIDWGVGKTKEQIDDYASVSQEFEECLKGLLRDLFDPDRPFEKCRDRRRCSYCNLRVICGR